MPVSYFLGIDPGRKGAFGLLSRDGLIARVWLMPEHRHNRGVDLPAVAAIVKQIPENTLVGVEFNTGRPGEVPDRDWVFGCQTGQLDAIFYPPEPEHIPPSLWTGRLGVVGKSYDPDCHARLGLWRRLYPKHEALVLGPRGGVLSGPLDALLIAEYLRQRHGYVLSAKTGPRPPKFYGRKEDGSCLE